MSSKNTDIFFFIQKLFQLQLKVYHKFIKAKEKEIWMCDEWKLTK